jgi:hypothetical protein
MHQRLSSGLGKSSNIWQQSSVGVFISTNDESYLEIVSNAIQRWNDVLRKLDVTLVRIFDQSIANITVGFVENDGHWSLIGNDSNIIAKTGYTMNLDPAQENFSFATALHEFGHAIGLTHDHQHPSRYVHFNRDALRSDLKGFDYESQIIEILSNDTAGEYDPMSIMHYPLKESWLDVPETIKLISEQARNLPPNNAKNL